MGPKCLYQTGKELEEKLSYRTDCRVLRHHRPHVPLAPAFSPKQRNPYLTHPSTACLSPGKEALQPLGSSKTVVIKQFME